MHNNWLQKSYQKYLKNNYRLSVVVGPQLGADGWTCWSYIWSGIKNKTVVQTKCRLLSDKRKCFEYFLKNKK